MRSPIYDDSGSVAATSTCEPPSAGEVQAVIGALIVEENQLRKANDPGAADAIGLAIEYWRKVLARAVDTDRKLTSVR